MESIAASLFISLIKVRIEEFILVTIFSYIERKNVIMQ